MNHFKVHTMHRHTTKTILLLVIIALLASAGTGSADEPEQATPTILAYNIKHGAGMDGKVDLSRSASLIKRFEPDLVALQEIDNKTSRTNRVDQAKQLGRMTEMHAEFGSFFDYKGGEYGMAVVSKQKPSAVTNLRLPDGREPRSALSIVVTPIEGGPEIVFVSVHFYATQAERMAQAKKLLDYLKNEERPVIIAGDFNSRPGGEVLKLFAEGWIIPDKGEDNFTFPSDKPNREIDFILFRGLDGWKVKKIDVIDEPVVSDHRPVLLELTNSTD